MKIPGKDSSDVITRNLVLAHLLIRGSYGHYVVLGYGVARQFGNNTYISFLQSLPEAWKIFSLQVENLYIFFNAWTLDGGC